MTATETPEEKEKDVPVFRSLVIIDKSAPGTIQIDVDFDETICTPFELMDLFISSVESASSTIVKQVKEHAIAKTDDGERSIMLSWVDGKLSADATNFRNANDAGGFARVVINLHSQIATRILARAGASSDETDDRKT